ncbi:C2 calcium-dependent domain-containing protein 4A-like [Polypterus senegalus]
MLSAVHHVSLKGAIDSMLTWTSLKVIKPKPADEPKSPGVKPKDIFDIVVTPDRIPKFCIPSLGVGHVIVETDSEKEKAGSGESEERESLCKKQSLRTFDSELEHSDPATRAALSLPHLTKITTPYGFLALGESPNIRRKESLFFESDTTDITAMLTKKKRSNFLSRSRSTPLAGSRPSPDPVDPPVKTSRSVSWDAVCQESPSRLHPTVEKMKTPKSDKKKFKTLIKKHIRSIKRMRSGGASTTKTAN